MSEFFRASAFERSGDSFKENTDLGDFTKEELKAEIERLSILIPLHNQSSNIEEASELQDRQDKARELLETL